MTALPRLELADHASPFDEALIVIDGREEETIRIECPGTVEGHQLAYAILAARDERRRRKQERVPTSPPSPQALAA